MEISNQLPTRVNPWSVYPGAIAGWIMDAFNLSMMFLLVPVIGK